MNITSSENSDIVVVGGGMGGVMAAMAARESGRRVLLVEPSNVLGGQGTVGGVAGFCGDTTRVNHLFDELVERLARHNLIAPLSPTADRRDYDLEWCAFFLQEMTVARGVDVLLHARVTGAEAHDGAVTRLTIATSGGLMEVTPHFVIDCSGSCVVPHLTGFPVIHEGANRQLPMSLYFTMWDTGKEVIPILPEGCPRWTNDDEIPMTSLHLFPTGKTEVKMKVVGFDAADGKSRSDAEIFARRQMHGLIYYLQTIGYRGVKLNTSVLASVSRSIGIREERRIVGEHVLTEDEVRRGVIFPDAIGVCNYHLDYHWPDRMERSTLGVADMLDPHHMPLRMMIPKGAKNLLVAGRGASGDQMAMSAFRVMVPVAQMGFAAGLAAAQCLETDTDLTSLDVPELQKRIRSGGQSIDLSDYGSYLRQKILVHEPVFQGSRPCHASSLVQLTNGRFLAAWFGGTDDADLWVAERRERRWSEPRRVARMSDPPHGNPVLTRTVDNRLHVTFATRSSPQTALHWLLPSSDEGLTWDPVRPLDDPGCPADAPKKDDVPGAEILLEDGTLARVFHPDPAKRSPLCIALSFDHGRTWPRRLDLETGPGEFSHPAVIPTRTGMAVTYTRNRENIVFWHGSIERIPQI